MYRVHELDTIRFRDRMRFEFINPWNPRRQHPFCYSSEAFLYLNSPEGHGNQLPKAKELLCWYRFCDTDHLSIP